MEEKVIMKLKIKVIITALFFIGFIGIIGIIFYNLGSSNEVLKTKVSNSENVLVSSTKSDVIIESPTITKEIMDSITQLSPSVLNTETLMASSPKKTLTPLKTTSKPTNLWQYNEKKSPPKDNSVKTTKIAFNCR